MQRLRSLLNGSPLRRRGSEGKALERKSSSVNKGFLFYGVLMANLAKKGCGVGSSLTLYISDLGRQNVFLEINFEFHFVMIKSGQNPKTRHCTD